MSPSTPDTTETWTLSFVAAAGHAAPMRMRVRRLLKGALRCYGLRCTRVWPAAIESQLAQLVIDLPFMRRRLHRP